MGWIIGSVNRAEAEVHAAKLAEEDPDRETHRFVPKEGEDGKWSVLKISIPPVDDTRVAETRAEEKPTTPDDPRDNVSRNIGGPYGGAV
jgi:hypothetical protein